MRTSILLCLLAVPGLVRAELSDVVVYGGTSAGVIAAVQAGRMGKSVVLIEPSKHLGGMTSGGLGATDTGNQAAIGGVAREFYGRILKHYEDKSAWKFETLQAYANRERYIVKDAMFGFEPKVAEEIFNTMLGEAKVRVVLGQRLDLKDGVKKEGARIVSIRMESGQTYEGKIFIDATYEGDLMAEAGVSYMLGRESNAQFGETLDGVQTARARGHQFMPNVDPYVKPGDKSSGLLPNIDGGDPGKEGEGDKRMQAYNYRICMTDVPENRVPFPKPDGYDEKQYELLLRQFEAGLNGLPWGPRGMPNHKTDTNNNGAFSTDYIGMNNDYPEADYATRAKIIADHVRYTQGFLWTLANHPRVPERLRSAAAKWGLAKDEFVDNQNWPYQLYVREARRMNGAYVMTEADCKWTRKCDDPIGLGSYGMDSHNTQRYVDATGHARNEGDVQVPVRGVYGISYRSLVPKPAECTNLLVPVCMSATHIAYGSIRMEPVYMIMGQACGTAAAIAVDDKLDVQNVPYPKLRERLVADKQLVEWKLADAGRAENVRSADLPGIVVDESKAKLTGEWARGAFAGIDEGYLHDQNDGKGQKSARFEIKVPREGRYEVRLAYVANPNRATNVPVSVESAEGTKTVIVDQRKAPPIEKMFVSLGEYEFAAGRPGAVVVSNRGTNGYVIIDAVQVVAK